MNTSRRFFIGGAGAFGAFGAFSGCRFFAVPSGSCSDATAKLKFGVVSDIHVRYLGEGHGYGGTDTLERTFTWFRDNGADAVMIVGDMADNGMVEQMQPVADTWYSVFPNDKAPDGRTVEKLFVAGNHDFHGFLYGDHAKKAYPDPVEMKKHVLRTDFGGWWKKIFHEDYSRFYRKTVKGYTFLGAHWDDGTGIEGGHGHAAFGPELRAFLDAHGKSLDPKQPFFYFQHPHPKNTCYGPWAWGHDSGGSTAALSPYANAIAFSGHSHYTLTDERSVWQGAFTSVGTSSLRYSGKPYNYHAPLGFENTSTDGKKRNEYDTIKTMSEIENTDCRQGMLWEIYDDRIVVKRREFVRNVFCGSDWVLPLTTAESAPFSFAERAKKARAPEFPKNAALVVTKAKGKTRKTNAHPSVEKDVVKLVFPAALASATSRPYEYQIVATGKDGKTATFNVLAPGYNQTIPHPLIKAPVTCSLALDRLPAGTTRLAVRPLDCWSNAGDALETTI